MRALYLRRQCGVAQSIAILVLVPIMTVGVAALLSLAPWDLALDESQSLDSLLLAISGVLGAVAGLLFAVMVLAVEMESGRAKRLSPLVRFLHRSSGLVPDAAFVLGVIASMVLASIWVFSGLGLNVVACMLAVFPAFSLCLAIILWHIHRLAQNSTQDMAFLIEKALIPCVSDVLDRHKYEQLLSLEFLKVCDAAGLVCQRYHSIFKTAQEEAFSISKVGEIIDVDRQALQELFKYLKEKLPHLAATVGLLPFDSTSSAAALCVGPLPAKTPTPDNPPDLEDLGIETHSGEPGVAITAADRSIIQTLVDQAFIVRERQDPIVRDLGLAVNILIEDAEISAEKCNHRQVKSRLRLVQGIIAKWTEGGVEVPTLLHLGDRRPRLFPFTLSYLIAPLIHAAVQSKSGEVLDEVDQFLTQLVALAHRNKATGLLHEAVGLRGSIYSIWLKYNT